MTAPHVEAKSLSSLNFLAANPPQYPVNPTEEKHDALTLYISRVPGARDVILSTFKPQRKNVTGEDVANSLYYVHLDSPSDEHLAAPQPIRDTSEPRSSGESSHSNHGPAIQRKPLPANARLPQLESRPSEGATGALETTKYPPLRRPADTKENVPITKDDIPNPPTERLAVPSSLSRTPQSVSLPVARKPLGPRPMGAPSTPEKELPLPPDFNKAAAALPSQQQWQPPRQRILTDDPAPISTTPAALSRSPSPSKRHRDSFTPFSLTIIRRDPISGHQWNIGKVSSFQSNDSAEDNAGHDHPVPIQHARGHPNINIHLETSGYAKFRGFPGRPSIEQMRPASSSSLPRSLGELGQMNKEDIGRLLGKTGGDAEEGFTRRVIMAYSKTFTSNIKEAFRRRERSGTTGSLDEPHSYTSPTRAPANRHLRQDSTNSAATMESAGSAEGDEGRESPPLVTSPGPGLRPKGYVFSSPWDGRCEFRTGNGGRSLKCRHVLNTSGGGFNPLVLAQGIRDGNVGGRHGSVSSGITGARPVSELRFNLPSADLFKSKEDRERAARELHDQFNKLLKIHHDDSDGERDEDDEPIFDFSALGREKAGGGNRGKRAKLGKLIIHDEGMKMLDLVVAANVGVWWGAWERSF